MRSRYSKKESFMSSKFIKFFLLILMSAMAIEMGVFLGNTAYSKKLDIVENIDTDIYKIILNKSLPIIDTIYNSGRTSTSISGDFNNFLKEIYGFEAGNPITILNTQSPYLYVY